MHQNNNDSPRKVPQMYRERMKHFPRVFQHVTRTR
nr:MAG TPA_asm: hypothetical protein [Caudoviricetes sp.]